MTSLKKTLCLLLPIVFTAAALFACGGSGQSAETGKPGEDPGDTTAFSNETTFQRVEDSLPESLNFGGEKVTILAPKLGLNSLVDI